MSLLLAIALIGVAPLPHDPNPRLPAPRVFRADGRVDKSKVLPIRRREAKWL